MQENGKKIGKIIRLVSERGISIDTVKEELKRLEVRFKINVPSEDVSSCTPLKSQQAVKQIQHEYREVV